MEKCKYYHEDSLLWGHGRCFAQKETPPCFSDGDIERCDISNTAIPIEVEIPKQTIYTPIDMQTIIDWIRNCDNLKELTRVKMEASNAIIHFLDVDDDDFRSRA